MRQNKSFPQPSSPLSLTLLTWSFACCLPTLAIAQVAFEIEYATFLGGSEFDEARELLVAPDGAIIIGGNTFSPDFPATQGVVQETYAGELPGAGNPGTFGSDLFLARMSPDTRQTLAATFFGGSKQDRSVYGLTLDGSGNIVFCGMTRSPDLQTTPVTVYQPSYGGGASDMMVAKISATLDQLIWSTYVGGTGAESPRGGFALDGTEGGDHDAVILRLRLPPGTSFTTGACCSPVGTCDLVASVECGCAGGATFNPLLSCASKSMRSFNSDRVRVGHHHIHATVAQRRDDRHA